MPHDSVFVKTFQQNFFPLFRALKGPMPSILCLLSLTMQKFRTLAAAPHSFIQFLTTYSRVVVLVQLLARTGTAWGIKQAQGTSAHLNHPSKRVCLGAKAGT